MKPKTAAISAAFTGPMPRLWMRAALSMAISGVFFWLLSQRLAHIDWADLRAGFSAVTPLNWGLAALLTGISFFAVGQYDVALHRHFGSGLPEASCRSAGICAIAVSQTLGFGLITGAILRWRMLPGQNLWFATRLAAAVSLSFLCGWAVVTSVTVLIIPAAPFKAPAVCILLLASVGFGLCLLAPPRWHFWPNSRTIARLLGLTAIDTLAAAGAFALLCPPEAALSFSILLPVFLIALGAGLVSGTPGGVGPFEMTLLALLPHVPEPPMIAAVLAWRVIYFALPAILGAIWAIRGPALTWPTVPAAPAPAEGRAELRLIEQGEHHFLAEATTLTARSRHFLVALFDPATLATRRNLLAAHHALARAAKDNGRTAVLYKCSGRSAGVARARGMLCLRIAQEAWLSPAAFRLGQSNRSGLRRKLRRAEAAGLHITLPNQHPYHAPDALSDIARLWCASHGGERGFSMGRFSVDYVARQRLYIAWQDSRPIAFVTFHQGAKEWTLDLMRYRPGTPDGTIHLLVTEAIADAARQQVPRLSLAAVPDCRPRSRFAAKVLRRMSDPNQGLYRFKASFAPHWQPLYLCAPGWFSLLWAAAEIARAILNPPRLGGSGDNEFASSAPPWHRRQE